MDEIAHSFADVARGYCQVLLEGHEAPLPKRITLLATWVSQVYTFALQLPAVDRSPPRAPEAPGLSEWPGLGSYEDYWVVDGSQPEERVLSPDLKALFRWLFEGLMLLDESGGEAAVSHWRSGFDSGAGRVLVAVLQQLHRAEIALRSAAPKTRGGPKVAEIVNLEREPDKPEVVQRPFLGVRFDPVPGGIVVTAVHPEGPAAGLLQPNDAIITIEGTPLGGLSAQEAGQLLVGEIGQTRVFEIFRGDETRSVRVTTGAMAEGAERLAQDPAGVSREVKVRILHPEGAARATAALKIIGCPVFVDGDLLRIQIPSGVAEDDVRTLLDAGFQAGLWEPDRD